MPMLDVFKADAFSTQSLTASVNKMPAVPGRVGRLGIFNEKGVLTPNVVIEELNGSLSLIPTSPRGGPGNQVQHDKRKVRSFIVPHLKTYGHVYADEVSGIRAFGSETEIQTVKGVVDQRLAAQTSRHDATLEYGRIGAIKGIILDADGTSVIYNLFTEFGVAQTTVDFVLGTAGTNIKGKCLEVKRAIEDELGMVVLQGVHCFCGKTWFDKFVAHPEVKAAYERWRDGEFLRSDNRRGFEFAGITFEEYSGKVGSVNFVADNEAHFFPLGVPGLFETCFAPADYMETVNTLGLPRYSKQKPMDFDRGVSFEVQSNPLSYCTRPKTLVKGTTSN
jgi:hypothetical protein